METLGLSEDDLAIGKKIITSLLCEGFIETKKKKLSLANPSQTPPLATGTLRMHPRGFGFVIPDPTSLLKQDVFIPKHLTDNAVDGDIVEIAVYPSSKPDKGPEGKVINIVKRTRSHLAGIIRFKEEGMRLLAHIPLFGAQRPAEVIAPTGFDVKVGDRVILKVNEWGGQNKPPLCEISHLIGHITDPTLDIPAAIEEFSLRSKFPTPSIEQAKSYGDSVSEMDKEDRLNLTEIETFTIDPDTAKDFDDALSLAKDELGYTLMVHIADVAHYVPQGSALDKEAFLRGNSTYFPGKCVPMLPEELSNNLCSLRPNVDRLCISVIMNFDFEGTLSKYQIHRSVIHSKTRFTYEEAKEILDEKKKSSHAKTLMLMKELCLLLKKKRYSRGSIDFALPEVVLEIDPQGMPTGFKIVEYDLSHQLVEEFMLKANEVVAKHLADQGKPLPYRIHEEPAPDSMEDFGVLARSLGFPLKDTSLRELQSLFEKAKDTPFAQQLSIAFIRSMKLAAYSAENIGHFGLSLEHYCHFTSPIRRYPDLVVQRLLFNQQPLDSNLELISLECSEKERLSFKAEMSVKTLKKLRLLKKYLDEDPDRFFDASISKIKPFGLYFEIAPYSLEGFLHISELEDDFFIFDAKSNSLLGEKKKIHHRIGDKIQIELLSVDFILQESKWRILGGRSPKSSHPPKPLVKKKKEKRHPKEKKHKRKRKS
ncbi:MAG: VacB/RNase II family 3'-5' exoribonuclease [Chlamydiae bacterium]|nr:VacB/RNase II family 3'-5' exoribonuclease [Chlamydiota bacterium]